MRDRASHAQVKLACHERPACKGNLSEHVSPCAAAWKRSRSAVEHVRRVPWHSCKRFYSCSKVGLRRSVGRSLAGLAGNQRTNKHTKPARQPSLDMLQLTRSWCKLVCLISAVPPATLENEKTAKLTAGCNESLLPHLLSPSLPSPLTHSLTVSLSLILCV